MRKIVNYFLVACFVIISVSGCDNAKNPSDKYANVYSTEENPLTSATQGTDPFSGQSSIANENKESFISPAGNEIFNSNGKLIKYGDCLYYFSHITFNSKPDTQGLFVAREGKFNWEKYKLLDNAYIDRIYGINNYIIVSDYSSIYKISVDSGKVEKILDGRLVYVDRSGEIFYSIDDENLPENEKGLFRLSVVLDSSEPARICSNEYSFVYADSNDIYLERHLNKSSIPTLYITNYYGENIKKIATLSTDTDEVLSNSAYANISDFGICGDWIVLSVGSHQGSGNYFYGNMMSIKKDGSHLQVFDASASDSFEIVDDWIYYNSWFAQDSMNDSYGGCYRIHPDLTGKEKLSDIGLMYTYQSGHLFYTDNNEISNLMQISTDKNLSTYEYDGDNKYTLFKGKLAPQFEGSNSVGYSDIQVLDNQVYFSVSVHGDKEGDSWRGHTDNYAYYRSYLDGSGLQLIYEYNYNDNYKNNSFALLDDFFNDVKLPANIRQQFALAVEGDGDSQEYIDVFQRNNNEYWEVCNTVFPYSNSSIVYKKGDCYFNIAGYYQELKNNDKALEWYLLSADEGNAFAAINAGDMLRIGDGLSQDETKAFQIYLKATGMSPNGTAYERLGECYENGVGTKKDSEKAYACYLISAFDCEPQGLYRLSTVATDSQLNLNLLNKAAASLDYDDGYFNVSYGGLDGYSSSSSKKQLIDRLLNSWDNDSDSATKKMKSDICFNQYFSADFVEALVKTDYTYSYFSFAEKYGVKPNRTYEDAKNIHFANDNSGEFDITETVKKMFEYDGVEFYEYDFDNDGINEIGIPYNSGAGGAFMYDGFGIFKKSKDGLYFHYADGLECSMRDGQRLINFNGKIYFINNPFSDSMDAPFNMNAKIIDSDGNSHTLSMINKDYQIKKIVSSAEKNYVSGHEKLLAILDQQAIVAINATKQHTLYSPADENNFKFDFKQDGDNNSLYFGDLVGQPQDICFTADIWNSGTQAVIQKSHKITQSKYYFDCYYFNIFKDETDFTKKAESVYQKATTGDYFGLHSEGTLYDLLPIDNNIVQFWTQKYDGITYCMAVSRNELLYTLYVFTVKDDKVDLVSRSLFFDEAGSITISFGE